MTEKKTTEELLLDLSTKALAAALASAATVVACGAYLVWLAIPKKTN